MWNLRAAVSGKIVLVSMLFLAHEPGLQSRGILPTPAVLLINQFPEKSLR
jgi:hypothetical protein